MSKVIDFPKKKDTSYLKQEEVFRMALDKGAEECVVINMGDGVVSVYSSSPDLIEIGSIIEEAYNGIISAIKETVEDDE